MPEIFATMGPVRLLGMLVAIAACTPSAAGNARDAGLLGKLQSPYATAPRNIISCGTIWKIGRACNNRYVECVAERKDKDVCAGPYALCRTCMLEWSQCAGKGKNKVDCATCSDELWSCVERAGIVPAQDQDTAAESEKP